MEFVFRNIEEKDKNLTTVERIWSELLDKKATRQDTLVAIGGGATLDTVGFAAATYKRGMNWIAVPTTLLSMVDAGTGGKTAVNFGGVKNSIGAFHFPTDVRIDTQYLHSLPYEELLSGYGEMLKHALLDSRDHLNSVLTVLGDIPSRDLILRSRAIKQHIVDQDPYEQGLRKALNFGHTIGHALEALSQEPKASHKFQEFQGNQEFQMSLSPQESQVAPLRHGYAVLYGMIAELYLSHILLGLDKAVVSQISHLIPEYYPRPNVSCRQYDRLYELMQQDKKQITNSNEGGSVNFTFLRQIGEPVINQTATRAQIYESLDYLFSL